MTFPFGARPIFRGKLAVSFRESNQSIPIQTALLKPAPEHSTKNKGKSSTNIHQPSILGYVQPTR